MMWLYRFLQGSSSVVERGREWGDSMGQNTKVFVSLTGCSWRLAWWAGWRQELTFWYWMRCAVESRFSGVAVCTRVCVNVCLCPTFVSSLRPLPAFTTPNLQMYFSSALVLWWLSILHESDPASFTQMQQFFPSLIFGGTNPGSWAEPNSKHQCPFLSSLACVKWRYFHQKHWIWVLSIPCITQKRDLSFSSIWLLTL